MKEGQSFEFYLDQKITIWKRTNFEVTAKTQKEADALAIQMYEKGELDELPWETIQDTEEFLTPEENDGCPTIELFQKPEFNYFDNTEDCIYRNGK